ncbi:MAG: hypothetical protein NTW58_12155 [Actinobacteria bacterium]|nr:hypothetical protein [Actinomycetota bacterium]
MKLEGPFEAEALRILRQIPGIVVSVGPPGADRGVDAFLDSAGGRVRVAVETRQRANAATAWQLVHAAEARAGAPLLLIADETTAEARAILGGHGIAVVDGLGNAHIESPGLLFHLEGRRRPRQSRPTRLSGKAGLVAQALLLDPGRGWQVQDLANEAGASVGMTHRVLARLEAEGLVTAESKGRNRVRRVTKPAALLDLWAEESAERPLRTLGYLLAQTPRQLAKELGGSLGRSDVDYALTGAAAAGLVAPFVTAVPVVEVWVTATAAPEELCYAAGAGRVSDGQNVVFLQAKDDAPLAFRELADGLWVVNRIRLYGDLRRDPRRGREQADHLRREVIGF